MTEPILPTAMVERAARALQDYDVGTHWDDLSPTDQDICRDAARAVLLVGVAYANAQSDTAVLPCVTEPYVGSVGPDWASMPPREFPPIPVSCAQRPTVAGLTGRIVRTEKHSCQPPPVSEYGHGTVWECGGCYRRWKLDKHFGWEFGENDPFIRPYLKLAAWWRRLRRRLVR